MVAEWAQRFADPDVAFRASAALLGVGQIVTSLEYLSIRREFGRGGLYAWPVLRLARPRRAARVARLRDALFDRRGVEVLLVARLLLATTLLCLGAVPAVTTVAVIALAAVLLLFNARLPWGLEGADDVAVHTALGLAVFAVCRALGAPSLGLWYVAAYAALAYVTAGVVKLAEPLWRSGVALDWVMNLESFGAAPAAAFLAPRPRLRLALAWIVMLAEVAAPLAILLPAGGIATALAAGLAFHLGLAACMGLNTFVWAFAATYPAVLHVWAVLHA